MSTNKVNVGTGNASGMFYSGAKSTALPAYPSATATGFAEVGAVSSDGIKWNTGRDSEPIKNWALETERVISNGDGGSVTVPMLYTDQKGLETIFGANNVTVTAATSSHGKLISVTVEPGVASAPQAYMFKMKDGEDEIMLGTTNGVITNLDEISFSPTDPIVYNITISAASWTFMKDDGQVTS